MYENFKVPSNVSIAGYRWDTEKPEQVMCIVHGIGEHIGRYDRMAKALNEAGIAVLGMDHRGHGLSEGKRGHAAPRNEVLQDIDSLLTYAETQLPGLPIVLYGHSMGGNVVLDYRVRGRLSGLPDAYIVSGPWIKLCKPFSEPVIKLAKILSKIKPDFQVTSAIDEEILGNPKYLLGQYKNDPLVHDKITALCAIDCIEAADAIYTGTLNGNGDGTEKPLLLMHGDSDMICDVNGSRQYAENEKNCKYIEWHGYYHEIHNGGPEATGDDVIAAIIDFVKSI